MTYRRDVLDARPAVAPSARNDLRAEVPARMGSFALPSRPPRETDAQPAIVAADAPAIGPTPEVILVKSGFRHIAARVREILFVEAARNYVRIHLESGVVLKSRVPIDRLARHLGTERFLRIHRGRLVNLERIRSVRPLAGGRLQLTLDQGATIIVARDRRRIVLGEISAARARRT